MDCNHKTIVLVDAEGRKLGENRNEIDFVVRCNDCDTEFLKVGRIGREIINLTLD